MLCFFFNQFQIKYNVKDSCNFFAGFFAGNDRLHTRPGFPVHIESLLTSSVNVTGSSTKSTHVFAEPVPPKVKKFYRLQIFPRFSIKVPFDRLALLAVLDRNTTIFENIFSILLAVLVNLHFISVKFVKNQSDQIGNVL